MKPANYFLACAGMVAATLISAPLMADSIVLTLKSTGHKYKLISTPLSWVAARNYCKTKVSPTGAYLVTITTPEENDFITDVTQPVISATPHTPSGSLL